DATPVLAILQKLPVETIGLDFIYSPGAADAISRGRMSRSLLAGLFDARNTKLESRDAIYRALDRLTKAVPEGRLSVSPSASLEFLPLDRCRAKIKKMVEFARAYGR
ncbi:MAG: hypothetical protein ACRD1Z_03960, partial [Vicinamibacteria bacterium]